MLQLKLDEVCNMLLKYIMLTFEIYMATPLILNVFIDLYDLHPNFDISVAMC